MKTLLAFLHAISVRLPRRGALVRAVNDTTISRTSLVDAINVALDGRAEWNKILFGVYPNKVGLQVFDRAAAEAIVAAFNDKSNRLATLFRGEPIYIGHPDDAAWARENPGVRAQAVGRIRELRIDEDGLAIKPAYNDDGRRLVGGDAPAYESFSPNWGMVPTTYQGRKAFRPVELYSIGLTNQPNIPGTYIGLNEKLPEDTTTASPAMKTKLIALLTVLGVTPKADATEQDLEAAINEATPKAQAAITAQGQLATAVNEKTALQTQLTAATGQVQAAVNARAALATQLATERTARAGLLITTAINEGRLTEAQRPEWLGKFTATGANFDTVSADLAKLTKAVNTTSKAAVGARRGQPVSAESRQRVNAINEKIESFKKAHPTVNHAEAYLAVQRDPANAQLFTNDKPEA